MPTQNDELIEDALRTYPLADVPQGFSKSILTKIKPQRPYAALKFRLTWLDYALGLFLSSLPAIGFVTWAFLPREFYMQLQNQQRLLYSPAIEPIVGVSITAMLVLTVLIILFGIGFLIRPQKLR
jgi:hypothetical protein